MCWKHEFAMAINNLQRAIRHIEKAQASLVKRLKRNLQSLERHRSEKKWNYPSILQPIEERINRNKRAVAQCTITIELLRLQQDWLYGMIQTVGISRRKTSKRLTKLMGDYKPPKQRVARNEV